MDTSSLSTMQRALLKDAILNPMEIVRLKDKSRRHQIEQILENSKLGDPYAEVEMSQVLEPDYIEKLSQNMLHTYPDQGDTVLSLYDYFIAQEVIAETAGYRGLSLVSDINMFGCLFNEGGQSVPIAPSNFRAYSVTLGREVSYHDLLAEFSSLFSYYVINTANILILNYYLDNLKEIEELSCVCYLKKWINVPDSMFNPARVCSDGLIVDKLLDQNDQKFINSLYGVTRLSSDEMNLIKDQVKNLIVTMTRA